MDTEMRRLIPLCLLAPFFTPMPCQAQSAPEADQPSFRIVESVPEASLYGEPGVPRTQAVWLDMIGHARTSIDIAAF